MAKYNCERYTYGSRRWVQDFEQDRRICQSNPRKCRGLGVAEDREEKVVGCPKEVCILGGAGVVCSLNVRAGREVQITTKRGPHGVVGVHKNVSPNTYAKGGR
jgi:hypothetical protein